jgi:hypothetical protein
MNAIFTLLLFAMLFLSLFLIIPALAPADQKDIIQDWVGLGFSGLLLVLSLFQTRFSDGSLLTPVLFYIVVVLFVLSGVYWWIPTFIPAANQSDTTKYMFLSTTLAIILVNTLNSFRKPPTVLPMQVQSSYGGRHR